MREIRTTLLPNGEQQVQAGGDFVYVDYVDREIKLMIHDQIITVNPGDKVRPARPFKSVTIINPDETNPVAVVLKVGEGDYNSQIIRGDVSVTPVLRKADGTTIADSRRELAFSVNVQNEGTSVLAPRDIVKTGGYAVYDSVGASAMVAGRLFSLAETYSPVRGYIVEWDQNGFYELRSERVDGLFPQAAAQYPVAGADETKELIVVDRASAFGWGQSDIYAIDIDNGATRYGQIGSNTEMPNGAVVVSGEILISMGLQSGGDEIYRYRLDDFTLIGVGVEGLEKDYMSGRLFDDGRLVLQCRDKRLRTYVKSGNGWSEIDVVNMGSTISGTFSAAIGVDTLFTHKTATTWQQVAWKNTRRTYGFPVNAQCAGLVGALAKKANLTDAGISAAAVSVTVEDRRGLISGELIRYALEIYTGKRMPDDYLDYVYSFKASNALSGLNEEAGGGAETFKKAKIADNFSVYSPSVIHISVDNELSGKDWL